MWRKHLVAIILIQISAGNSGEEFMFNGFGGNISTDGAATITADNTLLLTDITTYNQMGHAFYKFPLSFKDPSSNSTLSFSTTFAIQIVPKCPCYSGNGMAFVISPSDDLTGGEAGGYLGFSNSKDDGNSSNHILAIEFDTVPNPEFHDPDYEHVGIDINSMTSINLFQAGYYNDVDGKFVNMSLWSGKPIQVWVDYSAETTRLSVTISPLGVLKPSRPLVTSLIDLSTVLLDHMYVGFSAAIHYIQASHYVLDWSFKVNGPATQLDLKNLPKPSNSEPSRKLNVILPLVILIVVIIIILTIIAGIVFLVVRSRGQRPGPDPEGLRIFSYDELHKATNGFSEDNHLARGGSGNVYKGVIPNSNNQVAVKVILHDSDRKMREFHSEIMTIGRIHQPNLVRLQGYSTDRQRQLLLVYDFMPNGSLDRFLYGNAQVRLIWTQRFQIINQVASALSFLHQELNQMIVHRDIKASNVLLDANFTAKLGDFGISRLFDHGADPYTNTPAGTLGYMAPEVFTGRISPKTDVYAFGILMLEIACGRRTIDLNQSGEVVLKDWVTACFRSDRILDAVDQRMGYAYVEAEIELALKLGLKCSSHSMDFRPDMQEVMGYLNGHARLPEFTVNDIQEGPNASPMSLSRDSSTNLC